MKWTRFWLAAALVGLFLLPGCDLGTYDARYEQRRDDLYYLDSAQPPDTDTVDSK